MKAVIVAKTRMGSGACVGALTFEGQSLQLIPASGDVVDNLVYEVGDIWEIDAVPDPNTVPPHVENVIVRGQHRLSAQTDLVQFILQQMPPVVGGPDRLFGGVLQHTKAGALYVAERTGIPPQSTLFWQTDQPLSRVADSGIRIRYLHPSGVTVTFVGFQEPPQEIPADSLLHVSLAHWWRPEEMVTGELRCYVQLSGWIEPKPSTWSFPVDEPPEFWFQDEDDTNLIQPMSELPMSWPPADETSTIPNLQLPTIGRQESPQSVLRTIFGYTEFKPLQKRIIDNVLAGRDTLAIMPTGGGKSLCYQLPALLRDGLTVVVSPLIALMQDQVSQLLEWGIPALFLNSTLDHATYAAAMQQVRNGAVRLLYVAPETLLRPEMLVLLDESNVTCLAIDEAHCISQWGHDFRPEYRQLAAVRSRYPHAVCIALTATATGRVQDDIISSLEMSANNRFVASFDRPNLHIDVLPRTDLVGQTAEFLRAHPDQSGIIYCNTVKQVEMLAGTLRDRGFKVARYHGQLDNATRARNQTAFIRDVVPVMIATIAFGMGIDKPDVRFILHAELPRSIEHYYQQIGRAGRDDLPADCRLLYSSADIHTHRFFINQGAESESRGRELRLRHFVDWAESNVCRRRGLLGYFGQEPDADNCGNCDNCTRSVDDLVDLSEQALKLLACVYRTGQMFGATHVIEVLRGSRTQKVLAKGHDQLSTYGIGADLPVRAWQQLTSQLIQHNWLIRDLQYGSLKLSAEGLAAMKQRRPFHGLPLDIRPTRRASIADELADERSSVLFERLREERRRQAEQRNVPPYVIFSDRSLLDMVRLLPQDGTAFLEVNGVGQRKRDQYGDIFLPIIRDYCREHDIKPPARSRAARADRPTATPLRHEEVGAAFVGGWSLDALAQQHNVKRGTIIKHLLQYVSEGNEVPLDALQAESQLSAEQQRAVLAAFSTLGATHLRPVFEHFDGAIAYDELHLLRLIHVADR